MALRGIQNRLLYLLLAFLTGLMALLVHLTKPVPLEPTTVASAHYDSELLSSALSPSVLEAIVYDPAFQHASGAAISLSLNPRNSSSFRLEASHSDQQQAEEGLKRARDFLAIKLHTLALSGISSSISYLKKLEQESPAKPQVGNISIGHSLSYPDTALANIKEQQLELNKKKESINDRAIITVASAPITSLSYPFAYWLYNGLWLASLGLLLLALRSRPGSSKATKALSSGDRTVASQAQVITLKIPTKIEKIEPPKPELTNLIKHENGEIPSGILVLGSKGSTRCPVSMRLCRELEGLGQKVHLIDFDLEQQTMTRELGEVGSPGVSDLLTYAGRAEEFFASLPGRDIEFAPAGTLKAVPEILAEQNLASLLYPNQGQASPGQKVVTVIDASFSSPLQLAIPYVQAIFCLFRRGCKWNAMQLEVLDAIRYTRLPIWGISEDDAAVVRFL